MSLPSGTTQTAATLCACLAAIAFATPNAFSQAPPMVPTHELPTTVLAGQAIRGARALYFNNFAIPDGRAIDKRDPRSPEATITHTPAPKAELPQDLADTIVVGTITAVQAYLSQNRGAIYTESTISVEEVISSQQNVSVGSSLVMLHDGGAIQLNTGSVFRQRVNGSGNELQRGAEYVFFLRYMKTLQGYGCTKAWALVNNSAVAVSADDLARAASHTSTYDGMAAGPFLAVVRSLKASLVHQ